MSRQWEKESGMVATSMHPAHNHGTHLCHSLETTTSHMRP